MKNNRSNPVLRHRNPKHFINVKKNHNIITRECSLDGSHF